MVFAEFTFSSHLLRNCKRRKSLPTHCEAKYPKPKPKGEERCRRIDAVNLNKKSPLKLLIVYLFRGTTPWPACSCFIVQEQRALTFFYGAWSEEILYILKSLCNLMDSGLLSQNHNFCRNLLMPSLLVQPCQTWRKAATPNMAMNVQHESPDTELEDHTSALSLV